MSVWSKPVEDRSLLAVSVGGVVAIAIAALLVGFRGVVDGTNVALLLAVVVLLAAAVGGRLSGMATAVFAALAFDFFHTKPYGSLKIAHLDDVITTILLVLIGGLAGELSERLHAARRRRSQLNELQRLHRVASRASLGDTSEDLITQVTAELLDALHLRRCWYEPAPFVGELPMIEQDGSLRTHAFRWAAGGFELPRDGSAIPVRVAGRVVGRFALASTPGVGVPIERRLIALALAEQVGVVLALRAA